MAAWTLFCHLCTPLDALRSKDHRHVYPQHYVSCHRGPDDRGVAARQHRDRGTCPSAAADTALRHPGRSESGQSESGRSAGPRRASGEYRRGRVLSRRGRHPVGAGDDEFPRRVRQLLLDRAQCSGGTGTVVEPRCLGRRYRNRHRNPGRSGVKRHPDPGGGAVTAPQPGAERDVVAGDATRHRDHIPCRPNRRAGRRHRHPHRRDRAGRLCNHFRPGPGADADRRTGRHHRRDRHAASDHRPRRSGCLRASRSGARPAAPAAAVQPADRTTPARDLQHSRGRGPPGLRHLEHQSGLR